LGVSSTSRPEEFVRGVSPANNTFVKAWYPTYKQYLTNGQELVALPVVGARLQIFSQNENFKKFAYRVKSQRRKK
jgi:hypothetical protein